MTSFKILSSSQDSEINLLCQQAVAVFLKDYDISLLARLRKKASETERPLIQTRLEELGQTKNLDSQTFTLLRKVMNPTLELNPHALRVLPSQNVDPLSLQLVDLYNRIQRCPTEEKEVFKIEEFMWMMRAIVAHPQSHLYFRSLDILECTVHFTKSYFKWLSTPPKKISQEMQEMAVPLRKIFLTVKATFEKRLTDIEDPQAQGMLASYLTTLYTFSLPSSTPNSLDEAGTVSRFFEDAEKEFSFKAASFSLLAPPSSSSLTEALENFKTGKPITVSPENVTDYAKAFIKGAVDYPTFCTNLATLFGHEIQAASHPQELLGPHSVVAEIVSILIQNDVKSFLDPIMKDFLQDLKESEDRDDATLLRVTNRFLFTISVNGHELPNSLKEMLYRLKTAFQNMSPKQKQYEWHAKTVYPIILKKLLFARAILPVFNPQDTETPEINTALVCIQTLIQQVADPATPGSELNLLLTDLFYQSFLIDLWKRVEGTNLPLTTPEVPSLLLLVLKKKTHTPPTNISLDPAEPTAPFYNALKELSIHINVKDSDALLKSLESKEFNPRFFLKVIDTILTCNDPKPHLTTFYVLNGVIQLIKNVTESLLTHKEVPEGWRAINSTFLELLPEAIRLFVYFWGENSAGLSNLKEKLTLKKPDTAEDLNFKKTEAYVFVDRIRRILPEQIAAIQTRLEANHDLLINELPLKHAVSDFLEGRPLSEGSSIFNEERAKAIAGLDKNHAFYMGLRFLVYYALEQNLGENPLLQEDTFATKVLTRLIKEPLRDAVLKKCELAWKIASDSTKNSNIPSENLELYVQEAISVTLAAASSELSPILIAIKNAVEASTLSPDKKERFKNDIPLHLLWVCGLSPLLTANDKFLKPFGLDDPALTLRVARAVSEIQKKEGSRLVNLSTK
jgi:hypothetical protein